MAVSVLIDSVKMASARVAGYGVLIVAVCVVVVCESAALGQAQTTTLPIVTDEFPGPCRYSAP